MLTIPELLKDIDLPEIVQTAGVNLKQRGGRFVGLCPFHNDKIPSFFIFPDGHFKCFSCQAYGDAIDFVRKFYDCDFKQALGILGIKPGQPGLSPEQWQKIRRLRHRQQLIKALRRWEIDASNDLGILCRCARRVLGQIETVIDLGRYGAVYHDLEAWQYCLDILIDQDDRAKYKLWKMDWYG